KPTPRRNARNSAIFFTNPVSIATNRALLRQAGPICCTAHKEMTQRYGGVAQRAAIRAARFGTPLGNYH
ncbi:hypothetical protein, partial [Erythrobacter sp.]|uniref:hypothetical protein n=1 Tax=Erythrobacter sp. TaxID=1042 RepID=UPI003120168B